MGQYVEKLSIQGKRGNNEDNVFIWQDQVGRSLISVIAVADGMGGQNAGEVASSIAVQEIANACSHLKKKNQINSKDIAPFLKHIYQSVNHQIDQKTHRDKKTAGMGTTLVMAVVYRKHCMFANIGDSRAYIIREGHFLQQTMDHSVVAEQVSQGVLSWEEARKSPYRNMLTRSLDGKQHIHPDINGWIQLEPEDSIMLCSDGLHAFLDNEEMARIDLGTQSLKGKLKRLAQAAYDCGSDDNISIAWIDQSESEDNGYKGPGQKISGIKQKDRTHDFKIFIWVLTLFMILLGGYYLYRYHSEDIVRFWNRYFGNKPEAVEPGSKPAQPAQKAEDTKPVLDTGLQTVPQDSLQVKNEDDEPLFTPK